MLMSATIFEGYDITIFHLATPEIAKTFHLADPAIGLMATVVRFGGMMSFFVVILADRYGRKPIISVTVLCYTVLTLFTALSTGVWSLTLCQSLAQIFLAAEFGVAVTMISKEFPDARRGRAIAALHMVAFLGVLAAALTYAIMAESRWGWRRDVHARDRAAGDGIFSEARTARDRALQCARAGDGLPRAGRVPNSGRQFATR